jgi:GTP-binding protein HflX
VGFIRHLPHELVAAFKSTLQEASEAELLLHVVDAHSEDRDEIMNQVQLVLEEIGAAKIRRLEIFNKIDLLADVEPHIDRDDAGNAVRIWLSAESGRGISLLYAVLAEIFSSSKVKKRLVLHANQGDIRAKLSAYAQILEEKIDDLGASELLIEIDVKHLGLLTSVLTEEG